MSTGIDTELHPRVTLCLPTLNSERYLPERIESIRSQTLQRFRVIVVDGGSSDQTLSILGQWAESDRRVFIEPKRTEGLYQTFNRCLQLGSCHYMAILPADDVMPPNFLAEMIDALDSTPSAAAAVCPVRIFDECGERCHDFHHPDPGFPELHQSIAVSPAMHHHQNLAMAPCDGLVGFLQQNPYVSQTQIVYRQSDLADRTFSTAYGSTADILFNLQTGFTKNVVHVSTTWGGWRIHPSQASFSEDATELKQKRLAAMTELAIADFARTLSSPHEQRLVSKLAKVFQKHHELQRQMKHPSRWRRCSSLLKAMWTSCRPAIWHLHHRITGRDRSRRYLRRQAAALVPAVRDPTSTSNAQGGT